VVRRPPSCIRTRPFFDQRDPPAGSGALLTSPDSDVASKPLPRASTRHGSRALGQEESTISNHHHMQRHQVNRSKRVYAERSRSSATVPACSSPQYTAVVPTRRKHRAQQREHDVDPALDHRRTRSPSHRAAGTTRNPGVACPYPPTSSKTERRRRR
jgi:hypothetical protein